MRDFVIETWKSCIGIPAARIPFHAWNTREPKGRMDKVEGVEDDAEKRGEKKGENILTLTREQALDRHGSWP